MRNHPNEHPIESRGYDSRPVNPAPVIGRAPAPTGNQPHRLAEQPTTVILTANSPAYNGTGYRSTHGNRHEQPRPDSTPWVVIP